MKLKFFLLLIMSLVLVKVQAASGKTGEDVLGLIPRPLSVITGHGTFTFTPKTRIIVENEEQMQSVPFFTELFHHAAGWEPKVVIGGSPVAGDVVFRTDQSLDKEAYTLEVTPSRIEIRASEPVGFFYALQTVRQLLPVQIEQNKLNSIVGWKVPVVRIKDKPRFGWRGYMLDVSRHFFPKQEVEKMIDMLAMHKMNVFHWHLVDDNGWRIEIKKYPKLTEVGAWRVNHENMSWSARPAQKPGEKATYGGFYTQEDIREVVAYAKARFINIVPEIEMPAHSVAALTPYPQFSCTGGPFTVATGGIWPNINIYCAGNDSTFTFLEDVLSEVMDLFPSQYIHIGGDEATKTNWVACPKCQARIKAEGLQNTEQLQSYFIHRIEKFVNSKGRTLIGWDEILQGGLAPRATVMSWRGFDGGIAAARQGHDVVMTPTDNCYFDYYQGPQDQEPLAIGGYLPLKKVYDFEPVPKALNADEAKHILGGQANLWSEFVPTSQHLEYMTFPRLSAIAEDLWSSSDRKDWTSFTHRMNLQYSRYQHHGVNYSKSAFNIQMNPSFDVTTKKIVVTMTNDVNAPIYYTTDGSNPKVSSQSASSIQKVELTRSETIKAASASNGKIIGKVTSRYFPFHKAVAKMVSYKTPYDPKYTGGGNYGLVNAVRGSKNYADGEWQGWEGIDAEVTIDLETMQMISKLTLGTLQDAGQLIFLPKSVAFSISVDGVDFKPVGTVENHIAPKLVEQGVKDYGVKFTSQKARFVKAQVKNIGTVPGSDSKAWIFLDEFMVE